MQTFLPYPSFRRSARVLDDRRLGKQRVEALQVLRALRVEGYGWQHHPVVAMWRGFDQALLTYGLEVAAEWRRRGHRDTVADKLKALAPSEGIATQDELRARGRLPPWLGRRAFHRSHQSALVRRHPSYYRPHFQNVPEDLPYVWPVRAPPRRSRR